MESIPLVQKIATPERGLRDFIHAGLAFLSVFALWFVAASPLGDFPLNDGWAYAHTVRTLLDTGELRISEWSSATILLPVGFGALLSKLAGGFSFTTLRASTLVFSFVACLALFDLMRQLRLESSRALFAGFVLIVNPFFVYLSYTFMSDISYLAGMLISLSLYVRGVERGSSAFLVAGSVAAAIAYLSRQLGVTLPLGVACYLVLRDRRLDWRTLLQVGLVPLLVFVGHQGWLLFIHGLPWAFSFQALGKSLEAFRSRGFTMYATRVLDLLLYTGLFVLPASLARIGSLRRRVDTAHIGLFCGQLVVFGGYCLFVFFAEGRVMPYLQNVINPRGIGVLALLGEKPPVTPEWVFQLVTVVAPFAGAALGTFLAVALLNARRDANDPGLIVLIASAAMAVVTLGSGFMMDRYMIVFIPGALYLVLRGAKIRPLGWVCGFLSASLILTYTLTEVGDHMAWNTARWKAGNRLIAKGIAPEAIAGGFEWVGWFEFESAQPKMIAAGRGHELFAWMNMTPDEFFLSYQPLEKFDVVGAVEYRSMLSNRTERIFVLRHGAELQSSRRGFRVPSKKAPH